MLRELTVVSSLEPRSIDVAWSFDAPGTARPVFRLVRRLGDAPASESDGDLVVDVDDLFHASGPPGVPWGRIDTIRALATNGPADRPELRQASLDLFYATAASAEPSLVRIRWYDAALGHDQSVVVDEVSRVVRSVAAPTAPFTFIVLLEIFAKPGGGAEVSEGVVTFFDFLATDPLPHPVPAGFHWAPAAGPSATVRYDTLRVVSLRGDAAKPAYALSDGSAAFYAATPFAALPGRVAVTSARDAMADVTTWRVAVRDAALVPGLVYYYRLFTAPPFTTDRTASGSALATDDMGAHDTMYRLLPPVHRVADLETAPPGGTGQLYRFIAPFGAAVDKIRGLIDAVPDRHDIARARVDELPYLSRMIGWSPDLVAPAATQRQDLEFAAEVFAGVGTVRNPPALVNRVTSWPCAVKEFANNVALTNAPEVQHLAEIWSVTRTGTTWAAPAPLTLTTFNDADPTVAQVSGGPWVVWQSDRSGRRELWYQRPGIDAQPVRVMAGAPDDAADATFIDDSPTAVADGANLQLFWSSDRGGARRIWSRTLTPAAGAPLLVSELASTGDHPAALRDGGDLWLFWDSAQRGVSDVWYRVRSGGSWSGETRLVRPPAFDAHGDSHPAALMAPNGELWLFWCRDRGDRREIWQRAFDGLAWGAETLVSVGLATGGRDEAPWPVAIGTTVLLLFHSNRAGPWQLWSLVHDGATWHAPQRLSAELTSEKDPAAYLDGGGVLHVFWSTQRRAPWYRTRTLDFADAHMLAEMGSFGDHAHYVYDTGVARGDWYARGTVGLYLTPDTADPAKIAAAVDRAAAFLEPFRPAPVRFVWPDGGLGKVEPLAVGRFGGAPWTGGT